MKLPRILEEKIGEVGWALDMSKLLAEATVLKANRLKSGR